jgi:hypothetical protein
LRISTGRTSVRRTCGGESYADEPQRGKFHWGEAQECGSDGARLGEANLSIADEQAVRVEICRVLLNPPILASGAEYWLD